MTLPSEYTHYPNRRHGSDNNRYDWQLSHERDKVSIGSSKKLIVSIIVPLEYFMLTPSAKPFKHPGSMVTPYPDLRHFTTRDYGNRIGVYRLLKALADHDVKATFAINGALLDRIKPLIDQILADGHEIAAHGWDTDSIHWGGMDEQQERSYIDRTLAAFSQANLHPRAWMSPARQQSFRTPDLIRQAGFDICLDWEADSIPIAMRTVHGVLHAVPLLNELDDRFILQTKNHTENEWRDQLVEAAKLMISETQTRGVQSLAFTMTPYISGQPFRMAAVRDILETFSSNTDIKLTSVSETADLFTQAKRIP